jgi:hypothetical protein
MMASSEEGTDAKHFKSPVNHVIRRTGTLFGRKPVDGWVVFGDTIERGLFDLDIQDLDAGPTD